MMCARHVRLMRINEIVRRPWNAFARLPGLFFSDDGEDGGQFPYKRLACLLIIPGIYVYFVTLTWMCSCCRLPGSLCSDGIIFVQYIYSKASGLFSAS